MASSHVAVTEPLDFAPVSSKEFFDIQVTIECGLSQKRVRGMIKTCSLIHRTGRFSKHSLIIWPVWFSGLVLVFELSGYSSTPVAVTYTSDFKPFLSKHFLGIKVTIKCGLSQKCVRDMKITHRQTHRTDKFSQYSSIIWPVGLTG